MTPRRTPADGRSAHRGFTLVELLVAITLMAVLAVLGWRGLDSVLRSRERITEASDGLRAMSLAFSQLEEDLRRSWPVRLLHLQQTPSIGFVVEHPDAPPALWLLREMPPDSGPYQLQRVAYRLRDGVWERGFARWTLPTPGTQPGAEPPLVWQPLLGDVAGVQLRAFVSGSGWLPASSLLASGPGTTNTLAGMPILGIEALIERRNGDRVLRVLGVRD